MSDQSKPTNEFTTFSFINFSKKVWFEKIKIFEQLSSVNINLIEYKKGYKNKTNILIFADSDSIADNSFSEILDLLNNGFNRSILVLNDDNSIGSKKVVELIRAGLCAIFTAGETGNLLEKIKTKLERWRKIDELIFSDSVRFNLIGESRIWLKLLSDLAEAVLYSESPILIYGETGTGKELIANFIYNTLRRDKKVNDFIIVDCTTLSKELAGSELFGHEKGSFTNAISSRAGAVALADKGILFCDEISELPHELQGSLLRVFQEKIYKPVGSNLWRHSDFRLVCASNKELEKEVGAGKFRTDLYHRISGSMFVVPALNSRKEDIMPLAKHFMKKNISTENTPDFDKPVTEFLTGRAYPGNVRELEQIISNMAIRYTGIGPVTITDVPAKELLAGMENKPPDLTNNYHELIKRKLLDGCTLREIENLAGNTAIKIALSSSGGKVKEAARKLGITERTIQYRNYGNGAITKVN